MIRTPEPRVIHKSQSWGNHITLFTNTPLISRFPGSLHGWCVQASLGMGDKGNLWNHVEIVSELHEASPAQQTWTNLRLAEKGHPARARQPVPSWRLLRSGSSPLVGLWAWFQFPEELWAQQIRHHKDRIFFQILHLKQKELHKELNQQLTYWSVQALFERSRWNNIHWTPMV